MKPDYANNKTVMYKAAREKLIQELWKTPKLTTVKGGSTIRHLQFTL